ncbi:hypothetical protein COCCADRAFT_93178 [Bipolaris zeicola 26-R-13]|uniref:Trichothecene 3-O-acetyltransferase n=1 Tax=Cochliobolus carbonum (strain 26-R-13) TaxID=930089 RepID=W6Y4C5_COCC2|nr:uncharacterized protein COCCADRAFT_93178 [Bipolaris zeicola 26-R-13]EUC34582.1 hypothetical protein COCCADRAFT_93178 [Bipolaris zeicola 26-R-13]
MTSARIQELSPFDHVAVHLYLHWVTAFRIPEGVTPGEVFSHLRSGLAKTIEDIPEVAGELVPLDSVENDKQPGRWGIKLSEDQSVDQVLFQKDYTQTEKFDYERLAAMGMPPSELDVNELGAMGLWCGDGRRRGLFFAQANFVRGGLLLSTCVNHHALDAIAMGPLSPVLSEACFNRSILPQLELESESYETLKDRLDLWTALGLPQYLHYPPSDPDRLPAPGPKLRTTIISFSNQKLKFLKDDARPALGTEWISTNDALMALFWRSIMRSRLGSDVPDSEQNTTTTELSSIFIMVISARARLAPALPESYLGNAVLHGTTTALDPTKSSLAELALVLRSSLAAITHQVASSSLKLAAHIPNYKLAHSSFPTALDTLLVATNWAGVPLYDLTWGNPLHSPAEFVRLPGGHMEGVLRVLPRKSDGTLEVFLGLETDVMERFLKDPDIVKYGVSLF